METIKDAVNTLLGRKVTGPKVRYGVVGAGWVSQSAFMPGVKLTNNSELTVLVSDDPEKHATLAKDYKLKAYSYAQYDQLLNADEVDALYIATPNWMHAQFAVPALEKGYHVLLEKPMESTVEACQQIIAASKKSGAKLMVAYRLHNEPGTSNIYERVRKGDFGDPRIFGSLFTQDMKPDNHRAKHGYDAGPVPDMGPYTINAARNLFSLEPLEVTAVGFKTPGREFLQMEYDTVSAILRFPGDRVGTFTIGYVGENGDMYKIIGTKGELTAETAYRHEESQIAYKTKISDKEDSKTFPELDHFAGETEYFSDCILNNKEPEADGEEGMLDVRVIIAIKESLAAGGKAIKLEPYERTKRPTPDMVKQIKRGTLPKNYVGRDAQPPSTQ